MLRWGFTGKTSAEHDSTLRLCSLPLAAGQGEGWGGVAFAGKSLPSMARHYSLLSISSCLQLEQLRIAPAFDHQLFVSAAGFDAAVGQHQDAVGHAYR